MKRMFPLFVMLLLGVLGASSASAESVRAVVDTNRLRLGESLTLRVIADFGDATVEMPEIPGFRISAQGTSSRTQMINFQTTREVESLFLLIPLKTGSFTLPPIAVTGDGGTYYTQPVAIEVTARGTSHATDEPWGVTASVSNEAPYVGEAVVWTFRFQTAARFQNAQLSKPGFAGFASEALGEGRAFEQVINGRRYAIHEVSQLLIPQKPGKATIDPATLTVGLLTGGGRRSADPFFDEFFGGRRGMEQKHLSTDAVTLSVRPLPPYAGKAPFSGLVGSFSLKATLEKATVKAGDPLTVTLVIQGNGNIRDALAPALALPEGMKHYGDTPVEEIALGPSGWQGKKTFKTAIVPLTGGTVEIPPVTLVWFDPSTRSYRSQSTTPLRFEVTGTAAEQAETFQAGGTAPPPGVAKKEVRLKGLDILPLKVGADVVRNEAPLSLSRLLLWLGAPLGIFLLLLLGLKRFTRDLSAKERLSRRAAQLVKEAEKAVGHKELFDAALHSALFAVMGALSGRPVEGLTGEDIRRIVADAGGSDEAAEQCVAILASVEAARYGGGAGGGGGQKERVQTLVRLMKEAK